MDMGTKKPKVIPDTWTLTKTHAHKHESGINNKMMQVPSPNLKSTRIDNNSYLQNSS